MIARLLPPVISELRKYYPIVYIGGPRQSGKTTLLRNQYPKLPYANLEDPETRIIAEEDPRQFLNAFENGAILDEVQRVPNLFSYLQVIVDENPERQFILSGSQNFLLMKSISQSLAGRVGLLNLFPLSWHELRGAELAAEKLEYFIWKGGYPALYQLKTPNQIFFNNYIQTYIERDVRSLKNIGDLSSFSRFLRLCAGRVGQPLNMSNIANDLGLSVNTVKSWFSILEASYMIFYLQPFYNNFNKRIIKSPKFYFYDTGLLCYLLGITAPDQLPTHYYFGNITENAIIADLYKSYSNRGLRPVFWYWRDQHENEVDLIIEDEGQTTAIEIKSSQTYNPRLIKGLKKWQEVSKHMSTRHILIYNGQQNANIESIQLMPWQEALQKI